MDSGKRLRVEEDRCLGPEFPGAHFLLAAVGLEDQKEGESCTTNGPSSLERLLPSSPEGTCIETGGALECNRFGGPSEDSGKSEKKSESDAEEEEIIQEPEVMKNDL